jgi:hypothetical protein
MHKHRLCLKPNGRVVKTDRGETLEELERRGPRNDKEDAILKAWWGRRKHFLGGRKRPYHDKNKNK